MTRFSANLGFLWTEVSLPEAIVLAKQAGFKAVECHWPYATPAGDVRAALEETGLPMLGLNTARGDTANGDNGLAAVPGREVEARAAIDQAVDYANDINAQCVHVMAGFAAGPFAEKTFLSNLKYACDRAASHQITILIEPLNHYDAPGYFLSTTSQAIGLIQKVGASNLKLMFDCYHVQLMEGDLTHRLQDLMPMIGHIQFASVPDRGTPDKGEVNYDYIFQTLETLEYSAPLGAEYKPQGATADSLGWLKNYV